MACATAEQLARELGPEAIGAVEQCAEECRRLGEEASASFWLGVKAELEQMPDGEDEPPQSQRDAGRDVFFRRRRWLLMQKGELFRNRAMNAERLAAGTETHRQEMIDMAMQWFELSRQYEWLAETL